MLSLERLDVQIALSRRRLGFMSCVHSAVAGMAVVLAIIGVARADWVWVFIDVFVVIAQIALARRALDGACQ